MIETAQDHSVQQKIHHNGDEEDDAKPAEQVVPQLQIQVLVGFDHGEIGNQGAIDRGLGRVAPIALGTIDNRRTVTQNSFSVVGNPTHGSTQGSLAAAMTDLAARLGQIEPLPHIAIAGRETNLAAAVEQNHEPHIVQAGDTVHDVLQLGVVLGEHGMFE